MTRTAVVLMLGGALLTSAAAEAPEPTGYRMEDYRAPTPDELPGATVLSTTQAHELRDTGQAIFIDVLPQPPRPAGLPASTIWRPKIRMDLPG
ncbi:MAG: hypothetical protein JO227_09105, partial [Acetobacteraceae bacterium]|nr:hypothetical protein [Acetobacteraceae bacterium]